MSAPSDRPHLPSRPGPVGLAPASVEPAAAAQPIGSAHMRADGTLELRLRAESPGGIRGDAFFTVAPEDPRYPELVDHLGGIEPGAYAPVLPFAMPLL